MTVRVRLDRHRCVGAGTCLFVAPTAFRWRDSEYLKAELLDPETVDVETLRQAAQACPTHAIIVDEENDDIAPWAGFH